MAKKRGKKKAQTGSDRISQLPDPIIYHILSFVPTLDAVRMSLLSRRWRRVWYSVPTLRFSDAGYRRRPQVFAEFVENCFMHRERALRYIADSDVTRLELDYHYHYGHGGVLRKWLSSPIVRNCIEELDVVAERDRFARYLSEPLVVVSGRSLVTVKLKGLKWDGSCPVNLPSLKCLCLYRVSISGETLHSLVAGCPFLEKCLFESIGIQDLKLSSSSLKFLEIKDMFISVKVEAVNLRSLAISANYWPSLDISACTEISDLSLSGSPEVSQSLADQISKLALLENLSLTLQVVCKDVKISSPSLKTLSVTKICERDLKIIAETPNLVSFRYNGTVSFSLSMEAPNHQLNGLFSITRPYGEDCDIYWYNWFRTFLSNISFPWNSICLDVHDHKELIVPKVLRKRRSPFPDLKHMKIVSHAELTKESELRNSLKWISPSLETLSIEKGGVCKCMEWVSHQWAEEQKLSTRRLTRSSGPLQAL